MSILSQPQKLHIIMSYYQVLEVIGLDIKARRELLGLSQRRLAELCHIDRSHINRLEKGNVDGVTIGTLYLIAEALNCDLSVKFVKRVE